MEAKNAQGFKQEFLTNRDETGREIVTFYETGKQYFIEYIVPRNRTKDTFWGDIDPATKKVLGSYGKKFTGSIKAEDSMITKDNGFEEIKEGKGSPYSTIQRMHEEYKRNINLA